MGGVFDLLLSSWIWSEFFFFKRKNYGNICCIAERCLIFMIIEE